jgi:hypothetical protein
VLTATKIEYCSIGTSIPKQLLKTIDSVRGDVPRSVFMVRILEKHLYKQKEKKEKVIA